MLRYTNNTSGIMGLTLSTLGLFIATGILLAAVFSVVFCNNWQRNDDLKSLTSTFTNLLCDEDCCFFDHITRFDFPKKDYTYQVLLSSEYISITAKGYSNTDLSVKHRLFNKPWITSSQHNWTTGDDLHIYLNTTCGHQGTQHDPISLINLTTLLDDYNTSRQNITIHPVEIVTSKPVFLEKVSIYYESTKKQDFLLVYQLLLPSA